MVSKARLDLPEPLSPVMQTSAFRGKRTVTSLRLCSRAPCTTSSSRLITDPVYPRRSDGNVCSWRAPRSPPRDWFRLLAGVDVLDAVALVLEGRTVGAGVRLPAVVLAVGLRLGLVDVQRRHADRGLVPGPAARVEPERARTAQSVVAVLVAI